MKIVVIKLHNYDPVYLPADFCYLGKTLKGYEHQKAKLFNQGERRYKGSRPMSTKKPQGSLKWIWGEISYLSPGMQPLKPCLIPWAHRLCLYQ